MTRTPRNPGPDVDGAQADHFLGLPGAHIVATDALMLTRDNLADVIEAKAMMCVHGDAGVGKTLSVNASLRELAADTVCRVQFLARPTPRDIRHTLFDALGVAGTPPLRPIEFDQTLKNVLSERFRVLVCDEAQWMSRECFSVLAAPVGRPAHRHRDRVRRRRRLLPGALPRTDAVEPGVCVAGVPAHDPRAGAAGDSGVPPGVGAHRSGRPLLRRRARRARQLPVLGQAHRAHRPRARASRPRPGRPRGAGLGVREDVRPQRVTARSRPPAVPPNTAPPPTTPRSPCCSTGTTMHT
ncbi:hypothetical protein RHRU231_680018 [Rhodococcus ruber]|uniref:ORC1/DEAH AAA+ ATPase domain-containing protein n=1 Tax=Rhodococcus ruber TaxID=1830 RepID=A0A098BND7_9NOCA|nr:hypothetical protein RHRU231_680018 [Rhodococcus ruber]